MAHHIKNPSIKKRKLDSKEYMLELGLHNLNFLFQTEHLHYGYFSNLEPTLMNLKQAQDDYQAHLISKIPPGVKTILDVGCGSGKLMETLVEQGYEVDGIIPSAYLAEKCCGRRLNKNTLVFEGNLEDFSTRKTYDLIIFSESFQYMPFNISINRSLEILNPDGYILIFDFFKNDPEKKSKLGGGHPLSEWESFYTKAPVTLSHKEDITNMTAPTMDLANQLCQQWLEPNFNLIGGLLKLRYPWASFLMKRKFRKRLEKIRNKYFSGIRNADHFKAYKKYMVYCLQKTN